MYLQYHITVAKRRKRSVIRNPKKDKKMQRRRKEDSKISDWRDEQKQHKTEQQGRTVVKAFQ